MVDSYIETTSAGLEKVVFYIKMGEVYISGIPGGGVGDERQPRGGATLSGLAI
jgi:hypothetical protein